MATDNQVLLDFKAHADKALYKLDEIEQRFDSLTAHMSNDFNLLRKSKAQIATQLINIYPYYLVMGELSHGDSAASLFFSHEAKMAKQYAALEEQARLAAEHGASNNENHRDEALEGYERIEAHDEALKGEEQLESQGNNHQGQEQYDCDEETSQDDAVSDAQEGDLEPFLDEDDSGLEEPPLLSESDYCYAVRYVAEDLDEEFFEQAIELMQSTATQRKVTGHLLEPSVDALEFIKAQEERYELIKEQRNAQQANEDVGQGKGASEAATLSSSGDESASFASSSEIAHAKDEDRASHSKQTASEPKKKALEGEAHGNSALRDAPSALNAEQSASTDNQGDPCHLSDKGCASNSKQTASEPKKKALEGEVHGNRALAEEGNGQGALNAEQSAITEEQNATPDEQNSPYPLSEEELAYQERYNCFLNDLVDALTKREDVYFNTDDPLTPKEPKNASADYAQACEVAASSDASKKVNVNVNGNGNANGSLAGLGNAAANGAVNSLANAVPQRLNEPSNAPSSVPHEAEAWDEDDEDFFADYRSSAHVDDDDEADDEYAEAGTDAEADYYDEDYEDGYDDEGYEFDEGLDSDDPDGLTLDEHALIELEEQLASDLSDLVLLMAMVPYKSLKSYLQQLFKIHNNLLYLAKTIQEQREALSSFSLFAEQDFNLVKVEDYPKVGAAHLGQVFFSYPLQCRVVLEIELICNCLAFMQDERVLLRVQNQLISTLLGDKATTKKGGKGKASKKAKAKESAGE